MNLFLGGSADKLSKSGEASISSPSSPILIGSCSSQIIQVVMIDANVAVHMRV